MSTLFEYFKGINIDSISSMNIDSNSTSKNKKRKLNKYKMVDVKSPSRKIKKDDQYILDLGQTQEKIVCNLFLVLFFSKLIYVQCKECGMYYSVGSKIDEYNHTKYHKQLSSTVRFTGWKNMNIVYKKSFDEYIVSVDKNDSSRKKVKEIREMVDKNLGFSSDRKSRDEKVYLYILNKKVVGCIVVERIDHAFRLSKSTNDDKSISISKMKEPALVGVSRIWVFGPHRRNGIATTLLDVMRSDIIYGSVVPKNKVALSQPTLEGKKFGIKYFENEMFLVYEYEDSDEINCIKDLKSKKV